ncbi:hypothetical protein [Actinomadura macra]|nr:hypothetical protein [Actinomadura macra]
MAGLIRQALAMLSIRSAEIAESIIRLRAGPSLTVEDVARHRPLIAEAYR